METVDEEFLSASLDFIDRAHSQDKPFFVWFNSTRMHYYTHVQQSSLGKSGQGFYNDGMLEHDARVGALLGKLDELGIADNTIVVYSTDNGPHFNQWPDAAITPYRGEKNTNWDGGYRVPAMVRWPGRIAAGGISDDAVLTAVRAGDWKLVFAEQRAQPFDVWWDHKIAAVGVHGRVAVTRLVQSLQQFPPRQRPGTFTVDQIMEALYRRR